MNNCSDEDPKLRNFLRHNRPIIPPDPLESEDLLMLEIDLLPTQPRVRVVRPWGQYYIGGGIGIISNYRLSGYFAEKSVIEYQSSVPSNPLSPFPFSLSPFNKIKLSP